MMLRSSRPDGWIDGARTLLDRLLDDNPHASVQLLFEPTGAGRPEELLSADLVRELPGVCLARPSYLDKLYSVLPGRPAGAKRAILSIGDRDPNSLDADWLDEVTAIAPVMFRDAVGRWQEAGEVEDQVPA
jgi:hypothetical protein